MFKKVMLLVVPFGILSATTAMADDDIFSELESMDAGAIVELDTVDFGGDFEIDEVSLEADDLQSLIDGTDDLVEELCGYFRGRRFGYRYGGFRRWGGYRYRGFYRGFGRYYGSYRPIYRLCYRVCRPVYRSYWCY